jgi:hypothetical protein
LAVQRQVIGILRDQHVGQCALSRECAFDQPGPCRCLDHTIGAGPAGVFWPDRHDHAELSRHDVEPFGAIFPNSVHLTAATRTEGAFRFDHLLKAGQPLRQVAKVAVDRFAPLARRCRRRWGRLLSHLNLSYSSFKIFEGQLTFVG